jgi:YwiC-like protein
MPASSPRPPSLWPREHGAYVQLLAPLACALAARAPTVASVALAAGASLGFLASEPLRLVLGERGLRQRDRAGPAARGRLVGLGVAALIVGAVGVARAPMAARVLVGVVGLAVVVVLALSRRGAIQTVIGEIVAASALAGAASPVAVAGGMAPGDALVIWGGWALGYAATVIAVHHVLAGHRRPAPGRDRRHRSTSVRAIVVAGLGAAITGLAVRAPVAWFATPLVGLAAAILVRPPRATRLRAIGIGFLICSVVSAAWAVTVVRGTERGVVSGSQG